MAADRDLQDNEIDELLNLSTSTRIDSDTAKLQDGGQTGAEILKREYCGEALCPTLPPISDQLASVITNWLCTIPSRDKIKELFQSTLYPPNVLGLELVKINNMLYQNIPFKAKIADQCLHGINTYFSRGVSPIAWVLDEMIKLESLLASNTGSSCKINHTQIKFETHSFDVTRLRKEIRDSIKILATGNAVTLMKRHTGLKTYLESQYHHLLKQLNPITSELLGSNLEQKITDYSKLQEVARKLKFNTPRRFHKLFQSNDHLKNLDHTNGRTRGKFRLFDNKCHQSNKTSGNFQNTKPFPTRNFRDHGQGQYRK